MFSSIRTHQKAIIGFFLAAAFLLLAHGSILSHFFWDEDDFVYVSAAVGHSTPDYIFQREFYVQEFPRPVTHIYFWLISLAAGTAAWPYLLANLMLYALSAVLLFQVVKRLVNSKNAALAAAILYLVSPCATDNLYWVAAGATGFLSATLMLMTVTLYFHPDYDRRLKIRILSWFLALLAMGAKESALSLPILILALDLIRSFSIKRCLKNAVPFFVLAALMALNVILVQLSYTEGANFSKYGLSWMIFRNLLHFIVYPLVGALPPSVGRYTVLKMVVYPLLWSLPFVFGGIRVRKLAFFGLIWMLITSLPYLPWIMGFQSFFPAVCDIPSRYFNLPSMGAGMIMAAFLWMVLKKWGRKAAIPVFLLLTLPLAVLGMKWVRIESQGYIRSALTTEALVDVLRDSYDPGRPLYVCYFGFNPVRVDCYNRMYFNGNLIVCQEYPQNVPQGTRLLCGPKTSPVLYYFENGNWIVHRRYDNCEAQAESIVRIE